MAAINGEPLETAAAVAQIMWRDMRARLVDDYLLSITMKPMAGDEELSFIVILPNRHRVRVTITDEPDDGT